uniref:Uncharacterized protein n=1 Tax=uncultured bacterium lac193 TaxID=1447243 RepID=X2L8F0_9BACT|nr:hypothetical protein [uncultured bacterium lac193]
MSYRITPADIDTIEPVLVRLWSDNLSMRHPPRDKYLWYYRNNPLGKAAAFILETCNTEGHSDPVGSCGIGPRTIYVQGQPLRGGLYADFTVDKAHRTVLPALMLQRALAEYAQQHFDLAYAYPNDAAVGIFSRIGYGVLGRAGRSVRILRSRDFIARVIPMAPVAAAVSIVADLGLTIRDRILAARGPGVRLEWTADVDSRFDTLFEEVRGRYRIIGERSQAFLRWRFVNRIGVPHRIAALVDGSSGAVRAYGVVAEREHGSVLLADFLARTDDDLGFLLDRLSVTLRSEGYSTVVTYFLGSGRVAATLASHGFRFRNAGKFIVVGTSSSSPVDRAALSNTEDWYLTEADRDN